MAFTDSGTFIAWDPLRPMKTPLCMACSAAPPSPSRCGGCRFAHFCGHDCQAAGWARHQPLCAAGYSAYIARLEAHTQLVGRKQLDGAAAADLLAAYEAMLDSAEAMGDAEGIRHLSEVLAFRLHALGRPSEAHARRAARIEALIGKAAAAAARRLFGRVEQAKLTPVGCHAARGARRVSWCEWEQSAADLTASVQLPPHTRKPAVRVEFGASRLRVALVGGITLAEGELCGEINASESSWCLDSNGKLMLTLEKRRAGAWPAVLKNDVAESEGRAIAASLLEAPRPPNADDVRRIFSGAPNAASQGSRENELLELGPPSPPPLPELSPRDVMSK
ncbi:hypothetical protein AB1Y20_021163 [Prymnesium parvum]|uniref:MYND-type domain-containing protein n=1 Tax=Prymnesium parvum TaxID=97485 RepID=A0AB34JJL8_PRYPA